ncbi:MAG TPA: sensor histidine kinase KdpD [Bacteroidota bacterium]|nr:sensor histidine kinase KdpD [Bacteroidota bacterium]
MADQEPIRPDPDALLSEIRNEEQKSTRGKLKVFFGMCAGVGKTYEMLKSAHEALSKGTDVVIGFVETHRRPETEKLVTGLAVLPRKQLEYRGTILEEMDLDAVLARKPRLVLVDELAHTNAPGSRHAKRHQDVQEILDNGIDVYTTLNVQHLESRADAVSQITGSTIRETVPDSVFEQADEVELIDIPPEELLRRFSEGKVYTTERSEQAIRNFFRKGNLTALREMSLRLTAERVDHQLRSYMLSQRIAGPWKSGQRLLVGISPNADCIPLIRWARGVAYTLHASWLGVYVESAKPLSDPVRDQLARNIKLARELGAEILTTSDEDVARALVRVAKHQNATQILIGKPRHSFLIGKSMLDRIIEQSGSVDVYVAGEWEVEKRSPLRWAIPELHSGTAQYILATFFVCFVALVCFPFSDLLGYQTISLILLLTVALLPLKLGSGPVLLAATLSALIWDYFFIPPRFTFVVALTQDVLMLLTYFAIAAVSGVLTARVRAREKAVRQREERAIALYTLTKDLSTARTQDEVARAAITNVERFFESKVALFLSDPDGEVFTTEHPSSSFKVDPKEFSVAAWVYWNEKKAGRYTDTLPFARATYYPISGPRYPLGVIGVSLIRDEAPSIDQESLLQNFISQIASTLEREQLNEMTKKSIAFVESERLYKTLFNSLSHELHTPIAAIVSASEELLTGSAEKIRSLRKDLTIEIRTAAERLNRLVENLLDMTRLESGRITAKSDWCDIGDVVRTSLVKLGRELADHEVSINIPSEMPLLKFDFGLVEQTLTNLLHNAAMYTPGGSHIGIRVRLEDQQCLIVVEDDGPGFPKESLPRVFEKFYRVPGSKVGGTGLGLSIARGFVEAHRGTIKVENRAEGGARFTIALPLVSEPQPVGEAVE